MEKLRRRNDYVSYSLPKIVTATTIKTPIFVIDKSANLHSQMPLQWQAQVLKHPNECRINQQNFDNLSDGCILLLLLFSVAHINQDLGKIRTHLNFSVLKNQ